MAVTSAAAATAAAAARISPQTCDHAADLTGLELWPASRLLAGYLALYAGRLADALGVGVAAIEIGSGCGLPGLVAARVLAPDCIAGPVWLTDHGPHVLEPLQCSVSANKLDAVCRVAELDWGHLSQLEGQTGSSSFGLVLCSEVLFSSR
ncbi:MAG: hypothetical protein WDW36_010076 [Sanguina aurantia]